MCKISSKKQEIWGVYLGAGELARLTNMKIQLRVNLVPTRIKVRRYSLDQKESLKQFANKLENNGHSYEKPMKHGVRSY